MLTNSLYIDPLRPILSETPISVFLKIPEILFDTNSDQHICHSCGVDFVTYFSLKLEFSEFLLFAEKIPLNINLEDFLEVTDKAKLIIDNELLSSSSKQIKNTTYTSAFAVQSTLKPPIEDSYDSIWSLHKKTKTPKLLLDMLNGSCPKCKKLILHNKTSNFSFDQYADSSITEPLEFIIPECLKKVSLNTPVSLLDIESRSAFLQLIYSKLYGESVLLTVGPGVSKIQKYVKNPINFESEDLFDPDFFKSLWLKSSRTVESALGIPKIAKIFNVNVENIQTVLDFFIAAKKNIYIKNIEELNILNINLSILTSDLTTVQLSQLTLLSQVIEAVLREYLRKKTRLVKPKFNKQLLNISKVGMEINQIKIWEEIILQFLEPA